MLRWLSKVLNQPRSGSQEAKVLVVPQTEHHISPADISSNAITVMQRLNQAGHSAYLVGGGVRDLLLEGAPKDFDIATDATPEQVRKLFRNSRIIGRRFKIVHVRFGREIIEVTTFRGQDSGSNHQVESDTGQLLRDNVYGDLQSDALRRDFTVNALYYSDEDKCLYDYTRGLEDIKKRQLKMIGDPTVRYKEDPVRMLRAVRFAAKLGFTIEEASAQPITELAELLTHVPPARLFDEILKLFLGGCATATYEHFYRYGLMAQLFPESAASLEAKPHYASMIEQVMVNTDKRIRSGKRVTPAFVYACFMWPAFCEELERQKALNISFQERLHLSMDAVISAQLRRIMIPKRFSIPLRQIWELQFRLEKRSGGRAQRLLEHPKFRAAYDFLVLRESAGENLEGLGQWWTQFQEAREEQRSEMLKLLSDAPRKRKPRRRRKSQPKNKPKDSE